MRLSDIMVRAKEYLLFGGAAALAAAVLFVAGYFFVYKRLMKGQRRLRKTTVLWAVVFGCYLFVVLCATLLDRGSLWGRRVIPLFYSYREAWHSFSAAQWRNLMLNILLFVPLGFLLPLGVRWFRKFFKIYIVGFLFSLVIELTQLLLRRGVVELDDIFNNLLGTMIGYGFFALFAAVWGRMRKVSQGAKRPRIRQILLLQLPLLGTVVAFGILFGLYRHQELGNLSEECILAYDESLLKFSSNEVYDEEAGALPVYRLKTLTVAETEAQAEAFFALLGTALDKRRNDIYENTAVYYSTDSHHLWIDYIGGKYSFTDFGTREHGKVEDATEVQIREGLKSYGVQLPKSAVFENQGGGKYSFSLEQYLSDGVLYDGVLNCTYYENGRMGEIRNQILSCAPYKAFPVISEKEAYEKLREGKFANSIYGRDTVLEGEIGPSHMVYRADTKGFYQPVYAFDCVLNDREEKLMVPAVSDKNGGAEISAAREEFVNVKTSRVTVHDPSVVYDNGTYYVFGSHMAWAKTEDLRNWEYFTTNINTEYGELFGREWESWCQSPDNKLKGNLWAPDVIYNEKMEKYCLYMSVNGSDWNSAIVMLTADHIEGPYEYGGAVVYSGFDSGISNPAGIKHPAELTDVYRVLGEDADLKRYQSTSDTKLNCIDPCVTYDEEGGLWMSYGSWFGGIYLLKLDEETGLRDYDVVYETKVNASDAYYGYKIAGGCGVSGEGSYIIYKDGYYYLFLSYGGLTAVGGYQIRVFRSERINGPYVDEAGNPAVYVRAQNNLFGRIGVRLMGSYDWTGNREIRVAQGHNSAYVTEDGQIFLVYHSRFAGGKNGISEAHEVRVQQMFVNEEGWLVAAPYEYTGERISDTGYAEEEMIGAYEFLLHEPTEYYRKYGKEYKGIIEAVHLYLRKDGSVDGDLSGSWTYEQGTPRMSITLDGITYKGVFLKMPSEQQFEDEEIRKVVMTFTAVGGNSAVWGSK